MASVSSRHWGGLGEPELTSPLWTHWKPPKALSQKTLTPLLQQGLSKARTEPKGGFPVFPYCHQLRDTTMAERPGIPLNTDLPLQQSGVSSFPVPVEHVPMYLRSIGSSHSNGYSYQQLS